MPLPPLTTANAALQIANTLGKTLNAVRQRVQASDSTDLKTLVNTLYDEFAALREAVQRVTEENAKLRQQSVPFSPKQKTIHLSHSKPVVKLAYLDSDDCWHIGESKSHGTKVDDVVVILLPVFFDPRHSDPGAYIENARTSLVFTDKSSGQEYPVAHAFWIGGKRLNFLDIAQGDTTYILIAVQRGDEPALTVSNNKTDYDWYDSQKSLFDNQELPLGVYKLEVIIQWSSNGRQIFEMSIDLNELAKQQADSFAKLR